MRQYANSPVIQTIRNFYFEDLDATKFSDDFYNNVWNIETAGTYGLDFWGKVVNISRYFKIPAEEEVFGFNTGAKDWYPFSNKPFVSIERTTNTFRLENDAYRTLIYAKAMSNIFGRSCKNFNRMLAILFGDRGGAYVLDLGDMRIRFVFEFFLTPYEKVIIQNRDVFPRPAGVDDEYLEIPPRYYFGFDMPGGNYKPFNDGIFYAGQ